mmetsp:Transcript_105173/g.165989  ORF Transcript_105173/g.165989 Transcript_105173/m.165989 type:complete len:718 (+) Transcript_105173:92-2245(+)
MGRGGRRARSASKGGSVSNCSNSPPRPRYGERNGRQMATERRRAARERGQRTAASAMWVQQPPTSGQLPPQWPQLSVWPQPTFRAPRLSDLQSHNDAAKKDVTQSSEDSSDIKSDTAKRKKKDKKTKKEKKDKKQKKAKRNSKMACINEEDDGRPTGMISHLEPSDDEANRKDDGVEPDAKDGTAIAGDGNDDAPKKGGVLAENEAIAGSAEKMRQALTALRERREELQEVNAELDQANAELDELDNQLAEAEEELEKEREANKILTSSKSELEEELSKEREANKKLVSRTLEEQSQLTTLRSELDDLQKNNASLTSEVSSLSTQVRERQARLDEVQKSRDALADELAQSKAKLAQTQQEKISVANELETLQSNFTASQADLMVARESAKLIQSQLDESNKKLDKSKDSNSSMLQSKLKHTRAELDRARKEMSASGTEIYNSRRKQAALEKELAKARKRLVSEDARQGLNDAWEQLLSLLQAAAGPDELETGFDKLGAALRTAGFWKLEADTSIPAEDVPENVESHSAERIDDALEPDPLLARLSSDADIAKSNRKHKSLDGQTLERLDKAEKHEKKKEKKSKSEKKSGKDSKEPKDRKHVAEDPEESDLLPHRTDSAGPSSLKRRKSEAASSPASKKNKINVSFESEDKFVTQVSVTAFTSGPLKGKLWVANPLANVMCEKCERRVPQQQGRLQGNPGCSQFMQEKFHCHNCVEDR